ncbi:flagellar protein FliT [Roseateles sp. SL47]|uniref:flagellar protein FliT n=1 Tax=Roseateles sp. SL47 TaxID=2995138 RepID=UPI00227166E1|nr:flagellar protein FliT [Roseateles sp. SL47]WAC75541.1 flagellar protein FliT [Roseateles sp. SL47]
MPIPVPVPTNQTVAVTGRLLSLGERLREAAASGHWAALASIDAELAQFLGRLDTGRLDATERKALRHLQAVHQQVRSDCDHELEHVRQTLHQMQQQRGGWSAYAESQDWGMEPKP